MGGLLDKPLKEKGIETGGADATPIMGIHSNNYPWPVNTIGFTLW
jgi:hypothetical protein